MKHPPNHLIHPLYLCEEAIKELTKKHATPFYTYKNAIITERWETLKNFLPEDITLYYSVKANPNEDVIDAFRRLGAHFETASIGEIGIVRKSKCPDKIIFLGPAKTDADMEEAIKQNAYIVAESVSEVKRLNEVCKNKGLMIPIALRINPGKGKGVVSMSGNTPFGIDPALLPQLAFDLSEYKNIVINGLHFYLGTGLLKEEDIIEHLLLIHHAVDEVMKILKIDLHFLDIGGGFGIPYFGNERELDLQSIKNQYARLVQELKNKYPSLHEIAVEMGRYLVAPSGIFIAKIIDIKTSHGTRFILLDGGASSFNLNTGIGHNILPLSVLTDNDEKYETYSLCGPTCTPTDRLAANVCCRIPNIGDFVVFYQAGAYGYSAGPGLFLSRGFPGEVFID